MTAEGPAPRESPDEQCWALLATRDVGRLGVDATATPASCLEHSGSG